MERLCCSVEIAERTMFLTDVDQNWKYVKSAQEESVKDKSVTGGALSKDKVLPSVSSHHSCISGEIINSRVSERMSAYYCLANLLEVQAKISCNVMVPLIFELQQVDLELIKQQDVSFEIKGEYIVLHLKSLIDTGSSDTLIGGDGMGKAIIDRGVSAFVSSILDDKCVYQARLVRGYLKSGQVNVTIVGELVKPHNNILLMRMLANVLGIEEVNKQRCNLDDNFLSKPVQLVIGVLDCQVETVCMKMKD